MLKQQKIFFDFLRFCIGSVKEIPDSLKEADWKERKYSVNAVLCA